MVNIPDQKLFEPDPELQPREPSRLRRVLLWGGVVVAIFGLLYLSGFYQLSFFHRTPPSFVREPLVQIVDGDDITLPLSIVVLRSGGVVWSEEDISTLVGNAEAIWNQAGITFTVEEIEESDVTQSDIQQFLRNPEAIVDRVTLSQEGVTVVLVASLQGLNGIAYTGSELVAVADYTTSFNDRVFAHEIGHILGLGHVVGEPQRLMAQGSEGTLLTVAEATQAREHAQVLTGR